MKQTSIDAYNQIREDGTLSTRKFQVYEVLALNGPMTTGEIWSGFFSHKKISQNSINPRLSELVKLGVVEETGIRACKVTGRNCTIWATTGTLPTMYVREKTNQQKIKDMTSFLKKKGLYEEFLEYDELEKIT